MREGDSSRPSLDVSHRRHHLHVSCVYVPKAVGERLMNILPPSSCGSSDEEPLPPTSSDVTASPSAISALHTLASSLSPVFDTATTIAEQACYLPIPDRGRPLVGKVRSVDGVFIGSGHSCWGITQGPGTGKVLSEMILEGKAMSADVSRLLP